MHPIFNTSEEAAELAAARQKVTANGYKHIFDWILECGSSRDRRHCQQCKRRYAMLARDQLERQLDYDAEQLRKYGYQVIKPKE